LVPLLVGSAATGIGSAFDTDVHDHVVNTSDSLAKVADHAFGGVITVSGILGLFTAGRLARGAAFRATTYDMAVAAVVTEGYTEGLKYAVGRERPDHSDNKSFPSGHTSAAFSLAAVVDSHYSAKISVPAYLIAAYVGYSRLRLDKHWLSDVLAGATLGYISGKAVVRMDGEAPPRKRVRLGASPILGGAHGLLLSAAF
jgi:membrane-associated phospholipid phosphatase